MKDKRKNFSAGLLMAAFGVVLLAIDKLFVSASSSISITESFSIVTFAALIILLIAAIWLFWISFQ